MQVALHLKNKKALKKQRRLPESRLLYQTFKVAKLKGTYVGRGNWKVVGNRALGEIVLLHERVFDLRRNTLYTTSSEGKNIDNNRYRTATATATATTTTPPPT